MSARPKRRPRRRPRRWEADAPRCRAPDAQEFLETDLHGADLDKPFPMDRMPASAKGSKAMFEELKEFVTQGHTMRELITHYARRHTGNGLTGTPAQVADFMQEMVRDEGRGRLHPDVPDPAVEPGGLHPPRRPRIAPPRPVPRGYEGRHCGTISACPHPQTVTRRPAGGYEHDDGGADAPGGAASGHGRWGSGGDERRRGRPRAAAGRCRDLPRGLAGRRLDRGAGRDRARRRPSRDAGDGGQLGLDGPALAPRLRQPHRLGARRLAGARRLLARHHGLAAARPRRRDRPGALPRRASTTAPGGRCGRAARRSRGYPGWRRRRRPSSARST